MADFQGRSLRRRLLYSPMMVIILGLVILLLARPVYNIIRKSLAVRQEKQEAAAQLSELEARQAFLNTEIGKLETERGVEGEIRRKFAVAKVGERVIVVVATGTPTSSASTTKSWWQKLFE